MIRFVVILQVFLCFSFTAHAQDEPGKVLIGQTRALRSEILDETRTIKVWLPESYAKSSATYPVMYLLDAEMTMRFAKAAATVAELGGDKIPEMIVVGIDNTNRRRDMFPGEDGARSGADDFLTFLTGELFPYIDTVFRTASHRTLTGQSNSALFVVYALLKQPESFNAYFAISPMLGWRKPEMLGLAKQSFANFPNRNTFLYIEYGDQDYDHVINAVPEFIDILEQVAPSALKHQVDVLPGEGHVPYTSYRDALLALFPDFQMEEEDLTRGINAINEHYRALTQRYGFKIKAPAEPMVEFGELMLEQNDHDRAIEALKVAASRYPENITAYYRLGQAYEAADRLPEALAAYKRLLELYPQSSTIKVKVADLEKAVGQQGFTQQDKVGVTYIGNAGFMIEVGDKKILIDALFKGFEGHYNLPQEVQDKLTLAQAPFDDVDLVLVTHAHGDHADPDLIRQYLQNNPTATFASTQQMIDAVNGFEDRGIAFKPTKEKSERRVINGIDVEAFYLPHGTDAETVNIGFLVSVNGATTFQTGDADFGQFTFEEFRSLGLAEKEIDLAFIQHYYLRGDSASDQFVKDGIGGAHIIPIHYHFTTPEFDAAVVRQHYPDAIMFEEELQTWQMPE